jgi:hypothetical protein
MITNYLKSLNSRMRFYQNLPRSQWRLLAVDDLLSKCRSLLLLLDELDPAPLYTPGSSKSPAPRWIIALCNCDEELFTSLIKEASTRPGSQWKVILNKAFGEPSAEYYQRLIQDILDWQKRKRELEKQGGWWKAVAMFSSTNHGLTTPSPSQLSLLFPETDEDDRKDNAADGLLQQLKKGGLQLDAFEVVRESFREEQASFQSQQIRLSVSEIYNPASTPRKGTAIQVANTPGPSNSSTPSACPCMAMLGYPTSKPQEDISPLGPTEASEVDTLFSQLRGDGSRNRRVKYVSDLVYCSPARSHIAHSGLQYAFISVEDF